jgi:hypothetical protein
MLKAQNPARLPFRFTNSTLTLRDVLHIHGAEQAVVSPGAHLFATVYINTLIIQKVLAQPALAGKLTPRDYAAPTPLFCRISYANRHKTYMPDNLSFSWFPS